MLMMNKFDFGIGTPYWFEWEIGLLCCIELLMDKNIIGVTFQSSDYQSLDDVIVHYLDGTIKNIQIKHTDKGNNLTISSILSGEKSLLKEWAEDWNRNKNIFTSKEICIVTNKTFSNQASKNYCSFKKFYSNILPQLKENYDCTFEDEKEFNVAKEIRKQLSFLNGDAVEFIKLLDFIKVGNRDEIDKKLKYKISCIIGTNDDEKIYDQLCKLVERLRVWVTSARKKEMIEKEDVYRTLSKNIVSIKYNHMSERPIFPSRKDFAKSFYNNIKEDKRKVIFLQGNPGSGKTNLVSYMCEQHPELIDFRFYTYLPMQKNEMYFSDDAGYFTSKNLWTAILLQLREKFEVLGILQEINFPLIYDYLDEKEMRLTALKYLKIYSDKTKKDCILIIDGIDHAARAKSNNFLSELPYADEIPDGIKFVLVGQPINDKYPLWLRDLDDPNIGFFKMPDITSEDVQMLLDLHDIKIEGLDPSVLANDILAIVGNNALNTLFAVYELKKYDCNQYSEFVEYLNKRQLSSSIERYYEWILKELETTSDYLKIICMFAFSNIKLSLCQIAKACNIDNISCEHILNKLYPLIQKDNNLFFVFHNDVRLFLKRYIKLNSNFSGFANYFNDVISGEADLQELKYYFLFDLLDENHNLPLLVDLYSIDYIFKSIQLKVPFYLIHNQMGKILDLTNLHDGIKYISSISNSMSTLFQYYNSIMWNDKEEEMIRKYSFEQKTDSEIYLINEQEKATWLINDIYHLLKNDKYERAKAIYEKYIEGKEEEFFKIVLKESSNTYNEIFSKIGFLFRVFCPSCLKIFNEDNHYNIIFSGWLDASALYLTENGLKDTFDFDKYSPKDLTLFIRNNIGNMDEDVYKFLKTTIFSFTQKPLMILIDLCVEGILKNYTYDDLQKIIKNSYMEIDDDTTLEFERDKIIYFIKACFCIYQITNNKQELSETYYKILSKVHVTEKDRGYKPAQKILELCFNSFDSFYNGIKVKIDNRTIWDLSYIDRTYGVGSVNDCEGHVIKNFVFNILFNAYTKSNDINKIDELCKDILPIFTQTTPHEKYLKTFIPLFYLVGNKNDFIKIQEHWAGDYGKIWKESFYDIEFIYESLSEYMTAFDMKDELTKLNIRKSLRFLEYVGRKDYSLSSVIRYVKHIPKTKENFESKGLRLLSISDIAGLIGDNRYRDDVNRYIFKWAIDLGPKYVEGLFELKNNKDEFYHWRQYLIEEYLSYFKSKTVDDYDLYYYLQLYNAFNKIEIEQNNRFNSENSVLQIKNDNFDLVSRIKNNELKQKCLREFPNERFDKKEKNDVDSEETELNCLILNINTNGLTNEINNIINYFEKEQYISFSKMDKIMERLCNKDKFKFVERVVVPFMINNSEFGFHSNGSDSFIIKFKEYFSIHHYKELFKYVANTMFKKGYDYLFAINEDINTINFCYNTIFNETKVEEICNNMLDMHIKWITGNDLIPISLYSLEYDENVKTIKDLKDKLLTIN